MPGSSLWLLPPSDHPLDATLTNLINSTSTRFNSPHLFVPHVTLTVDINPATYATEPQAWLNSLILPDRGNVKVQLGELQSDDFFFKKLYFNVGKHGVGDLAKVARMKVNGFEEEETANMWVEKEYKPHLSLLYQDCPEVDGMDMAAIKNVVTEAGVNVVGEGKSGGWVGGRVVLVPTYLPIHEWAPIAERTL